MSHRRLWIVRIADSSVGFAIAQWTISRLPGLTLVPAFLRVSWKERRGIPAYLCSLTAGMGTLLYSLFCGLQFNEPLEFNEPLAFLKVQRAWHPQDLAYGQAWLKSLVQITLGPSTWRTGKIADPLYAIAFLAICAIAYLIWQFRQRLREVRTVYRSCVTLGKSRSKLNSESFPS